MNGIPLLPLPALPAGLQPVLIPGGGERGWSAACCREQEGEGGGEWRTSLPPLLRRHSSLPPADGVTLAQTRLGGFGKSEGHDGRWAI